MMQQVLGPIPESVCAAAMKNKSKYFTKRWEPFWHRLSASKEGQNVIWKAELFYIISFCILDSKKHQGLVADLPEKGFTFWLDKGFHQGHCIRSKPATIAYMECLTDADSDSTGQKELLIGKAFPLSRS